MRVTSKTALALFILVVAVLAVAPAVSAQDAKAPASTEALSAEAVDGVTSGFEEPDSVDDLTGEKKPEALDENNAPGVLVLTNANRMLTTRAEAERKHNHLREMKMQETRERRRQDAERRKLEHEKKYGRPSTTSAAGAKKSGSRAAKTTPISPPPKARFAAVSRQHRVVPIVSNSASLSDAKAAAAAAPGNAVAAKAAASTPTPIAHRPRGELQIQMGANSFRELGMRWCAVPKLGKLAVGTPVVLQVCRRKWRKWQQWRFSYRSGLVHNVANPRRCLAALSDANGEFVPGADIEIAMCDSALPSQQWEAVGRSGLRHTPSGMMLALDAPEGARLHGRPFQLAAFKNGDELQFVRLRNLRPARLEKAVAWRAGANCIGTSSDEAGAAIVLAKCTGVRQRWHVSSLGTIHWAPNPRLCVDVEGGELKQTSLLRLWPCNYSDVQRFERVAKTRVVMKKNRALVVDLQGGQETIDTRLWLWVLTNSPGQTLVFGPKAEAVAAWRAASKK